jgi:hypothetical protein
METIMVVPTEEIPCDFVGSFKVGDNLGYNATLLCNLVELNDGGRFNKLIVLQVGAILEAALSEIIFRAQHYNREGVPNITEVDRKEIEGKKIDKFALIIDVMSKYKILDDIRVHIYDDLHKLRKYRNKIHIQESIRGVPPDEDVAFSNNICVWAIELNRCVIKHLSDNFARPNHIRGHVLPLKVPLR